MIDRGQAAGVGGKGNAPNGSRVSLDGFTDAAEPAVKRFAHIPNDEAAIFTSAARPSNERETPLALE